MVSTVIEEVLIDAERSDNSISLKLIADAATDEVLVSAARLGDCPAFRELWERHSNTALNMAYRITKDEADAEDAAQDAWMKAYAHLKTFDGRAKFSTWLTRIVINSALTTLRRKRAHPETSIDYRVDETWKCHDIADPGKDVEELYSRRERAALLQEAICSLEPALRKVVEIQQLRGGTVKETADLAGISVAATKSRLLRARSKLRIALGVRGKRGRDRLSC